MDFLLVKILSIIAKFGFLNLFVKHLEPESGSAFRTLIRIEDINQMRIQIRNSAWFPPLP